MRYKNSKINKMEGGRFVMHLIYSLYNITSLVKEKEIVHVLGFVKKKDLKNYIYIKIRFRVSNY